MNRVLIVGLDEPEYEAIRTRIPNRVVCCELLPKIQVVDGRLFVESPSLWGRFLPVSRVVYHGIFEDDFPFITTLALWGGPCLPNARGMMDCRQRIPCLVRALSITKFGSLPRGYADQGTAFMREGVTVAKWGEWHCGENKEKFTGSRISEVPTLYEAFVQGEAVRVHLMGERAWQIRMAGDDWLKSIHHADAAFMPIDAELVEDAERLRRHFGVELLAVDYMVAADGSRHLLEVNHIPNVTLFPEIREAYLDLVTEWVGGAGADHGSQP